MRAKRSKKYRKIMSSYNMHFSFRTPYQVLCASTFLRQCSAFHMPVQKSLENTLHGDARPYITQCSLARAVSDHQSQTQNQKDSRGRGDGKPSWLPPPTEVPLRYCKHKDSEGQERGIISEEDCLLDLVSGQVHGNEVPKNKNHYVLATADVDEDEGKKPHKKGLLPALATPSKKRKRGADVREAARQVAGVPIIYVKRSVMVLEELSGASERVIRSAEKAKFRDGVGGEARGKRKREDEDSDDEDDGEKKAEETPKKQRSRGMPGKAKGPNPKSVMKKRVRPTGEGAAREGVDVGDGKAERQPKKRRRRTHGKKGDGEMDGTMQESKVESASVPAQTE